MSENRALRAWRLYALLGILLACGYLFLPSEVTRHPFYDVVDIVVGLSAIAAVLIGIRLHRPVRSLPWYLFALGLLLLVSGSVIQAFYEIYLGKQVQFPSLADPFSLAFYPFAMAGLSLIGSSKLTRRGAAGLVDPLVIATSFLLLAWVYFMEPYVVEAHANNPSVTPTAVLTALAYPSMDLLLLAVLLRTLLVSKSRPPAYRLLGLGLGTLLFADIAWTVGQALGFAQLGSLVGAGFLLFLALFGAAALHPSMATLFEPVIRVEARLTRPRLALLAGASLVAPFILALQAIRGEPINAPLFVVGSATLFLLVVARMAGMMRARERAADREKVLRRAGSALAASQTKEGLHAATLEASLELLKPTPLHRVSLWVGPADEMKEAATTGEATEATFGVGDLPERLRACFAEQRSMRVDPAEISLAPGTPWQDPKAREIFVVPLRARGEPTGALVVLGRVPLPQESQNALEALGAEVALALENLQLLEEVRRTSVLNERQRLSHEIHDTLAQGFTSIVMNLSAAQLAHPEMFSDSAPAQQHLEMARRTARESLAETRRLVWALRPEALDRHPLPQALRGVVEEWSEKTSIEAHFRVEGCARQLLPETEVALLRIAQEALANIHKHAGAEQVVLTLSYLEDLVALDVSDNGVGFDPNRPPEVTGVRPQDTGGFGLVSMRERVQQLGGSLAIESTPNEGTTLAATLPASLTPPGPGQRTREREAVEETR